MESFFLSLFFYFRFELLKKKKIKSFNKKKSFYLTLEIKNRFCKLVNKY